MAVISMKQLLEAGVHFGHQTRRWNPKMAQYIFTERNSIYIIDLQKTVKKIDEAYLFVRDVALEGKDILFVGKAAELDESGCGNAKVYDIGGRCLLPGIVDSHIHPGWVTKSLWHVRLPWTEDVDELLAFVKKYGEDHPKEECPFLFYKKQSGIQ